MKYINAINIIYVGLLMLIMNSCQPGGNFPGREYMPDMAHSTAYEANVLTYYELNTWGGEEDYRRYAFARLPVAGTQARSETPYYYEDTEADRLRATEEIVMAKTPLTAENLASGKELYNIYCAICHGDKGNGDGYLVREDGGVFPAQPANFLSDDFIQSGNGRYYHALIYGKNVMSGYADKLSANERWNVIHYIRSLQAKSKGLSYDENANTLNNWTLTESEFIEQSGSVTEVLPQDDQSTENEQVPNH